MTRQSSGRGAVSTGAAGSDSQGTISAFHFLDVLDGTDLGVIITDAARRVVWMSRALERVFGLPAGLVTGMDLAALVQDWIVPRVVSSPDLAGRLLASMDRRSERLEVVLASSSGGRRLEHWSWPIAAGAFVGGRIDHFADVTRCGRTRVDARGSLAIDSASRSIQASGK